ncbi:MAG: cobalamin-dependent protein [Gammaproteobacteria bacterium]|nr:cobalamin-dependent protein [Gammaproteobacteria bacterium]
MSRVLLVNARICSPRSARLPLSLLHLGAVLEGRHEYTILDGNLEPDCARLAAEAVRASKHDLVGLSVMPGPQVGPSIEVSRAVRAADPDVPIVWGGYFPTLYTAAALNAPYVDYVVRGQGEETLLALLDALPGRRPTAADSGAPAGLETVAGLSYKRDGAQVHTRTGRSARRTASTPLPYHRAGDPDRYLQPS